LGLARLPVYRKGWGKLDLLKSKKIIAWERRETEFKNLKICAEQRNTEVGGEETLACKALVCLFVGGGGNNGGARDGAKMVIGGGFTD